MLLDWFRVLFCLRVQLADLQKGGLPPHEGFREENELDLYHRDRTYAIYGQLDLIGNCGDCGSYWMNDNARNLGINDGRMGENECTHCGLKHELQWHMRDTEENEKKRLLGR